MEIQEQFEALVNKGVAKALEPYKDAILAMAELVRSAEPYNQEKCPAARKKTASGPRVDKKAIEEAKKFNPGQMVHYRHGRGEFEARVEEVTIGRGEILLKRISDGLLVSRPATKVIAA